MNFNEKKYLKYKKKYFDLKGSAPPVHCKRTSSEHILHNQEVSQQPPRIIKIDIATLAGNRYSFDVKPDDTILSIKLKLFEITGIPIYQQIYEFKEQILEDINTLSFYKITDNSTIKLIVDLKVQPVVIKSNLLRVYVMRHADRADESNAPENVKRLVDREEDTPLWPVKGIETVNKMTRKHLMKPDGPIDLIVSSPLLRCIQTADAANKIIKKEFITIDAGLCEVWNRDVLKGIALKKTVGAVKMRTLKELETFGINTSILKFNENIDLPIIEETSAIGGTADARFRDSIKRIAIESARSGHHKLLLVSHGDCAGSFIALCTSERKVGSKPKKLMYSIDFCGIVVADYDVDCDKWTLVPEECDGVGIMDGFF